MLDHQVDHLVELSTLLCCPINVPPEQRLDEVPNRGVRVSTYVLIGPEFLEDVRVHIIAHVREPWVCRVGPKHCPLWELHSPPVGPDLLEAFSLLEAPGNVVLYEVVPVLQVLVNPHFLAQRPEVVWHASKNSCCYAPGPLRFRLCCWSLDSWGQHERQRLACPVILLTPSTPFRHLLLALAGSLAGLAGILAYLDLDLEKDKALAGLAGSPLLSALAGSLAGLAGILRAII